MAKKNSLSIVLIHQIGREVVGRDPGAPVPMAAGKWSGNVENTASFVWTMHRPELSDKLSEEEKEKYRGLLKCFFDKDTLRITEWNKKVKKGSVDDYLERR